MLGHGRVPGYIASRTGYAIFISGRIILGGGLSTKVEGFSMSLIGLRQACDIVLT